MDYSIETQPKQEECWTCTHDRSEWVVQAVERRGYRTPIEHRHDQGTSHRFFAATPGGVEVGADDPWQLQTAYASEIDRMLAKRGGYDYS